MGITHTICPSCSVKLLEEAERVLDRASLFAGQEIAASHVRTVKEGIAAAFAGQQGMCATLEPFADALHTS